MALKRWCWLAALVLLGLPLGRSYADGCKLCRAKLPALHGKLVDLTSNDGHTDRRIWSRALHQRRDLYVYLPPRYDPHHRYPLMIFLHGFNDDEKSFLSLVPFLDSAIASGKLPPLIIAAPDGSIDGEGCKERPGSFWLNTEVGPFEDFVLEDVWDYVTSRYSVCPQREAHVLAGVSMGGFAAFNLGMRHRDAFGVVAGVHPPLNLRWADCDLNPCANFDPRRWGWRLTLHDPEEVVARVGVYSIRMGQLLGPVFGFGDGALQTISRNNPIELVDRTRLKNGDLQMFVGYAGQDEFNIDAQVESFLYLAKYRGLGVHVAYDPHGHHDAVTAARFVPHIIDWLAPRLAPFAPGACEPVCRPATLP